MVNTTVVVIGVEEAMKALQAAFPTNPREQRKILNRAMSQSAKRAMVPMAKELAAQSDASGALSESIGIRNASKRKIAERKSAGFVEMVPIRGHLKAMAMYIQHYYTDKGLTAPAGLIANGLRYGHLVEFGSKNNPARSFLWDAAAAQSGAYQKVFGEMMTKQIEASVKRAAKKMAKQ